MKTKLLLLFATMALCFGACLAQSSNNEDEVVKIDKWNQQAYREGEILVKFKSSSTVQMRAPQRQAFRTSQDNAIDALFQEIGVDSVEQLMPRTGHKNVGRKMRAYNGSMIEVKDLSRLYRLTLRPENAPHIHEAIERLKADDEIEFAEPNYLVYAMALPYDTTIQVQDSATYVSEPLYSQQWGLSAINLPELWNKPKRSSKRPVIAILDTGVDIEHPDLVANIWTNPVEANGISGQDDDANGYRDDIHGWDFINQTGIMHDFNGHGTHCAGIAAAVGNNGIGITGANPDAYIMPITVMQSNGTGDFATVIHGIDYAAANGADVISMSFGGYSYSVALEQALGRAYASTILVAAAGNDALWASEYQGTSCHGKDLGFPMYPAGISFVLGVEASEIGGCEASFSNVDAHINGGYIYELRAPGARILSTFPGGRYKILNGTSMACPLAAGAISRLIQCKETLSQELLFGDLIKMRQTYNVDKNGSSVSIIGDIDALSTYNISDNDRHPELYLVSFDLTDTLAGDGDARADAGETIEIFPVFKNAWGQANNIRFWIKTGYDRQGDWMWDDTTLITHLQDTAYFGKPLSSYAQAKSLNPWRMSINPNCADGRKINFTLFAQCDNTNEILSQRITIEVENGVELGGLLTEDMTLYPNVHYISSNSLYIPAGKKLIIQPGTKIKIKTSNPFVVQGSSNVITKDTTINGYSGRGYFTDYENNGKIIAKGTKDSMIVFVAEDVKHTYKSNVIGLSDNYGVGGFPDSILLESDELLNYWEYIDFQGAFVLKNLKLKNCILQDETMISSSNITNDGLLGVMERCNFTDYGNTYETGEKMAGRYNNIIKKYRYFDYDRMAYNNVPNTWRRAPSNSFSVVPVYKNYYGTSSQSILRSYFPDASTGHGSGYYDISSALTIPAREAHGIVWKILVNGYDAQDDFDSIPPLGVGTHRCEVYFNRPMDVSIEPIISFGVREPFTQHQVNVNGSWSADSTVYTAYFIIDAKTVSDGLNTFKVYGARDDEHFEIPVEDHRYKIEIAATGSMSTGLMAEAGLGKIKLTWETDEEDFEDLLGYNIYRWTNDTIRWDSHYNEKYEWVDAGWRIDTICINPSLIDVQDTMFVDYDVVPGKDYYYIIRQMTTSLSSYDISNPVTARPLTAVKGDANGSMTVDVADVITEVNFITHQNPQPFIFEAADVNSDDKVDIVDIVGTIQLILHPENNANAINESPAYYYVQNGILYVETETVLGGVQVSLNGDSDEAVTPLDALNDFEKISLWQTDEDYLFMAYSMSGKTLGVGTHALLQIGDAEITNIVLSDAQGHNVIAVPQVSTALDGTKYLPNCRKFIENDHLYIQIGNRIYSTTGQLIK